MDKNATVAGGILSRLKRGPSPPPFDEQVIVTEAVPSCESTPFFAGNSQFSVADSENTLRIRIFARLQVCVKVLQVLSVKQDDWPGWCDSGLVIRESSRWLADQKERQNKT
jgi:hypothetical protein